MLGWDRCGKEALGDVSDLYHPVNFKVQKQSRGDGKKEKRTKESKSLKGKQDKICVKPEFTRTNTDRKSDAVSELLEGFKA